MKESARIAALRALAAGVAVVGVGTGTGASGAAMAAGAAPARPVVIVPQQAVVARETPPHNGTGMSTAYRYSDGVAGRSMEFRVRALHPGASIGEHVLSHDEIYYVLSGEGDLIADGVVTRIAQGTAVYIYTGNNVGIRQAGSDDLVLAIAYPLTGKGTAR